MNITLRTSEDADCEPMDFFCCGDWETVKKDPFLWTKIVLVEKLTADDLRKVQHIHPGQYKEIVARLVARKMSNV